MRLCLYLSAYFFFWNIAAICSGLFPLVSGTLVMITAKAKVKKPLKIKNTYWLIKLRRKGNARVRMNPENQLVRLATAMAVFLALCGNTSAVYKNGMGPRLNPKQHRNRRMHAMLKYGKYQNDSYVKIFYIHQTHDNVDNITWNLRNAVKAIKSRMIKAIGIISKRRRPTRSIRGMAIIVVRAFTSPVPRIAYWMYSGLIFAFSKIPLE